MIHGGFFPKRIEPTPEHMQASGVREICSVSQCISPGPEDWIEAWLHNDWGWFNRIEDARAVTPRGDESMYRLFAYRVHPTVFTRDGRVPLVVPSSVHPEAIDDGFRSLGFDSVSKSMESVLGLECSPLSCNGMAPEMSVNEFCLFRTLAEAVAGAERFAAEQPEPGSYYVVEVLAR